jgi:hypothetical protein
MIACVALQRRPGSRASSRAIRKGGSRVFRPGQLEYHSLSASGKPGYHLQLDYRVEGTPEAPQWACFHLRFEAGATLVEEQFRMHRDVACNFLQRVRQCLRRHGVPVDADILFGLHGIYDPLFEDLRRQLCYRPGEAVDLDRFLREG